MDAKLQSYLTAWNLKEPQILAETATSQVYLVCDKDEKVVLKLLKPIGIKDEKNGAHALEYYDGYGAARLLRYDEGAHLVEYIAGDDLLPMVRRGGDEEATRILGATLNKLHRKRNTSPPTELIPLRRRMRALFLQAEGDTRAGKDSIYRRAAPVAEALLSHPREECVLHGDMHHENVRHHPERGWLAYDPKGLFGERTFDAANSVCNPGAIPELVVDEQRMLETIDSLAGTMRLERKRLMQFVYVYACLSSAWSLEDGQEGTMAITVASMVEDHL